MHTIEIKSYNRVEKKTVYRAFGQHPLKTSITILKHMTSIFGSLAPATEFNHHEIHRLVYDLSSKISTDSICGLPGPYA